MAERSSLTQVVQIGVETTPGVAVAANKRLSSISIEPTITSQIQDFRPAGQKFRTVTALGKEWTDASVSGTPTYTEIVYMLSSVLTTAVVTNVMNGTTDTGAREWLFQPSSTAADTPKTFTIEHGSAVRAGRFAHGLFTEIGMDWSRDSIDLSGAMMGTTMEDGVTLTASPTSIDLVPILPTETSVYIDNTAATLGTTKMSRVLSANWALSNRYGPVWVLDAANTDWVAFVEIEPTLTLSLTVEADAEGMALLNTLRDGSTKFIRIESVGAEIATGVAASAYRFTLDMAGKVNDTGGFSDEDGVYAIEWDFVGVTDDDWGRAFQVKVVNSLTGL